MISDVDDDNHNIDDDNSDSNDDDNDDNDTNDDNDDDNEYDDNNYDNDDDDDDDNDDNNYDNDDDDEYDDDNYDNDDDDEYDDNNYDNDDDDEYDDKWALYELFDSRTWYYSLLISPNTFHRFHTFHCHIYSILDSCEKTSTNGNDGCFPINTIFPASLKCPKSSKALNHLKNEIDSDAYENVQQYGSYLNLDLVAAACCVAELPLALDAVLAIAGSDDNMDRVSSSLGM